MQNENKNKENNEGEAIERTTSSSHNNAIGNALDGEVLNIVPKPEFVPLEFCKSKVAELYRESSSLPQRIYARVNEKTLNILLAINLLRCEPDQFIKLVQEDPTISLLLSDSENKNLVKEVGKLKQEGRVGNLEPLNWSDDLKTLAE